jgi:hypothetical protein
VLVRNAGPDRVNPEQARSFEGVEDMINYRKEARRYRPKEIRTLLIAESPPPGEMDYFYVPKTRVREQSLPGAIFFHYFGTLPLTKEAYEEFLTDLQERGVFLIDISDEPLKIRNKAFANWIDPIELKRLKDKIPDLRGKIQGLGITISDERIKFLLPRAHYKRELRRLFPQATFYLWKEFRTCPEEGG